MRVLLGLLLLFGIADGCWFSSKSGAVKHIEKFMKHLGKDPEEGLDHGDFKGIIKDAPSALGWAIKKLGSIEGVFDRCDYDEDGKIKISEVVKSKHCLTACWKQAAIQTFL